MGLLLICLLVGWFLTPYVVAFFWLFIAVMPFVAIYNGESANLILILFCLSALLMPGPFRSVYLIGAVATIMFMLVSSVAVAAYAYVVAHPDQFALLIAAAIAIILFFIPRKPLVEVNEPPPRENPYKVVVTFHPHPSIAQLPGLIAHDGGRARSEKPLANPS